MGTAVVQDSPNLRRLVGVSAGQGVIPVSGAPPSHHGQACFGRGAKVGQRGGIGWQASGEKGGTRDTHGSGCFPTRMEACQHSSTRCDHSGIVSAALLSHGNKGTKHRGYPTSIATSPVYTPWAQIQIVEAHSSEVSPSGSKSVGWARAPEELPHSSLCTSVRTHRTRC